jgi:hypothetical protein
MSNLEEKEENELLFRQMEEYAKDLDIDYKINSKRSSLPSPAVLKFSKAERFDG